MNNIWIDVRIREIIPADYPNDGVIPRVKLMYMIHATQTFQIATMQFPKDADSVEERIAIARKCRHQAQAKLKSAERESF